MIKANDPKRKSWLDISTTSDFPIQNIPFGVFMPNDDDHVTTGTRIGDYAIDLSALHQLGYFEGIELPYDVFLQDTINDFMMLGKAKCRQVRDRLAQIFDAKNHQLRDNEAHRSEIIYPVNEVQVLMPVFVQDYTDFYSSREHAENVGTLFRGKDNALMPNWLHLPVGYHGRSSSIVISGENIRRPMGQMKPPEADAPVFGATKLLDFELEMAFITNEGKPMGERISVNEAEDYIFGMVIFNDWSARDIQGWEYVPLGPFLGKSFASSISPWVVTLDALEPFRAEGPQQDPTPLPYLQVEGKNTFDINLEVAIQPDNDCDECVVTRSNFRYLYWNMAQQLAHHTVNGCNINAGDMMASGTISGPTESSYGSLLELSWRGSKNLKMKDGTKRKFLQDGDTVSMRAFSKSNGLRIGFGEVKSKVLPAQ